MLRIELPVALVTLKVNACPVIVLVKKGAALVVVLTVVLGKSPAPIDTYAGNPVLLVLLPKKLCAAAVLRANPSV